MYRPNQSSSAYIGESALSLPHPLSRCALLLLLRLLLLAPSSLAHAPHSVSYYEGGLSVPALVGSSCAKTTRPAYGTPRV